MKFTPGDKVLLKRTLEEGVVRQWLGKDVLEVEVNGVVFPAFLDELDHPYLYWYTQKHKTTKASVIPKEVPKEHKLPPKLPSGLYLQFYPVYENTWEETIVEGFKIYLVNETEEPLNITYEWQGETVTFKQVLNLHPFQNTLVHDVPFTDFAGSPTIHVVASSDTIHYLPYAYKLKPKKAQSLLHDLLLSAAPNISHKIVLTAPIPVSRSAQSMEKRTPVQVNDLQALKPSLAHVHHPEYIDLHAEVLGIQTKGRAPAQILDQQIAACEHYLEEAKFYSLSKVTLVHGHGKGVLKSAVRALLKTLPYVKSWDQDWDPRFGFGATHVVLAPSK